MAGEGGVGECGEPGVEVGRVAVWVGLALEVEVGVEGGEAGSEMVS